ncbi:MAG: polysaccharide biosynthesis tyrosine autokinase [Proteobacteria bacterium]|nr:polysaccharide biosynthesis tyrosine autokinase [Pseudomonadota bacterium]
MQDRTSQVLPASIQLIPSESDENSIDIWWYVHLLRRRWKLVALAIFVVLGIATFFTLRATKIYRATTIVQIEPRAPRVLGRDVEVVDEMGVGSSRSEYYTTQYKILESLDLTRRVVKELNLNSDPGFFVIPNEERDEFKPASMGKTIESFKEILTVEPVRDSELVKVHVDHADPFKAQLYANTVAKKYLDRNLESILQSTVDAVDWLSDQLDGAQKRLSVSEQKIQSYKKENSILSISLEDRQNILAAQMMTVATQLAESRAKRIEIQARRKAIDNLVRSEDPLSIPLEAINSNVLIQQLKKDHGELHREYSELSKRYGGNFPRMIELEANLESIRDDIKREVKNILVAVNSELNMAKSTEAGLQKTLDEFRDQALTLSHKELAYNGLMRKKETNEDVYKLLLGRTKEADLSRLLRVNNVHILDRAMLPTKPIKPRVWLNLSLALVIGMILGMVLAFVVEYADRTIKTQDDVEMLGVTFLGVVPHFDASSANQGGYDSHTNNEDKPLVTNNKKKRVDNDDRETISNELFVHEYPKSQIAESCRAIRTNLYFMSADQPAKRILVTSPLPSEGKTTVAVNLALVMAQSGSKILLVDTDLRRPRVHQAFELSRNKGVSDVLSGDSSTEHSILKTGIENLDIMMCGPTPSNPTELMLTDRFASMINKLSESYDRIIFDSPPVGVVTDAAILSKLVDGTVLVFKSLHTTVDAARHAMTILKDIDANILGAVLNNLDFGSQKYGQKYYYYRQKKYGYY